MSVGVLVRAAGEWHACRRMPAGTIVRCAPSEQIRLVCASRNEVMEAREVEVALENPAHPMHFFLHEHILPHSRADARA
jgi:hypothetical protein